MKPSGSQQKHPSQHVELPTNTHASLPSPRLDPRSVCASGSGDLALLLLGAARAEVALPALGDLLTAALSLATGRRHKVLLPLEDRPVELAFVRRGGDVLVSCYETGSAPEILVLDRPVELARFLDASARAVPDGEPARGEVEVTRRLAARVRSACVVPDRRGLRGVRRRGGALADPGEGVPLSFGFRATIHPGAAPASGSSARADVHALLFQGELWAWVRGRRVPLAKGPVMLAVQRMVTAVSALVEAWDAGRQANVRLNAGTFRVGVRLEHAQRASVTLGDPKETITVTGLDVPGIALPVLRLATDLSRALVSADRAQARNLRVRELRGQVRELRRRIRSRRRDVGFVNHDPDRLRLGVPTQADEASGPRVGRVATGRLRFAPRWRLEVDELDAMTTFLCGDRLVITTGRRSLALDREDGEVLWAREGAGGASWMAGTVLLRGSPEGSLELCDVSDGEPYAVTHITPRVGAAAAGVSAGGGGLPPVAILPEGENRLVAIDLRNGEHRWRFTARGAAAFRLRRAGRVLLAVSGDGSMDALDVASGEVVWRFTGGARFSLPPAVCQDVVVAVSGDATCRKSALHGLDLYSGELMWTRALDAAPTAAPLATGSLATLSLGDGSRGSLACFDPRDGSLRWMVPDPGVGVGGSQLTVDGCIIVNAPAGHVTSLSLEHGRERWARHLSDPVADDVPRTLEPVLRGGALFVPAASVHVLRPADGSSVGPALPCDLVPDLLRVDERGWVYVAEESGMVSALAPVPHLRLVRGGRGA